MEGGREFVEYWGAYTSKNGSDYRACGVQKQNS